jgi:hypothetical protein
MQRMDRAVENSLSGMTLKEFAMSDVDVADREDETTASGRHPVATGR